MMSQQMDKDVWGAWSRDRARILIERNRNRRAHASNNHDALGNITIGRDWQISPIWI